MSDVTRRYEIIGDLYYRRHRRLRPGKSEAVETYRDSCSDENRAIFDAWIKQAALFDAVNRIAELEDEIQFLTEEKKL